MPVDTLSLAGKIAIVTGSGRENGIGAGIARALARNGAAVTINYVSDSVTKRAQALADSITADGGRATVVRASVETPEGAKSIVQETLKAFGTDKVDILVNNAGTGFLGGTVDATPEEISKTFDLNVKGTIFVTQATIPHMAPGGRIINISSTDSRLGPDDLAIYGASKAAWGRSKGITVNAVAPGPVVTDIAPPEIAELIRKPQREITRAAYRNGTIEDIGDSVLLLVSEKARWITGQYISVSGGVTGL